MADAQQNFVAMSLVVALLSRSGSRCLLGRGFQGIKLPRDHAENKQKDYAKEQSQTWKSFLKIIFFPFLVFKGLVKSNSGL